MKELSELFIEYTKRKKVDVYEIFSDHVNGDDFDVDELRDCIDSYLSELDELKFDCNKITFMVERVGLDYLMVHPMEELDYAMDGWKASKVCEYCNHDKFNDLEAWFYFDEVYPIAYSGESLTDCFSEYGDLDDFIMALEDGLNEYYEMWSDETIEDNERYEECLTELGCVYLY